MQIGRRIRGPNSEGYQMISFLNALPGAVSQGLVWGIMSIGVYITYKLLDIADLTVDGSFCTGGAVGVMLIVNGYNIWLSLLAAIAVGMLAGFATGLLHTRHPVRHFNAAGPVVRQPGHHGYEG